MRRMDEVVAAKQEADRKYENHLAQVDEMRRKMSNEKHQMSE